MNTGMAWSSVHCVRQMIPSGMTRSQGPPGTERFSAQETCEAWQYSTRKRNNNEKASGRCGQPPSSAVTSCGPAAVSLSRCCLPPPLECGNSSFSLLTASLLVLHCLRFDAFIFLFVLPGCHSSSLSSDSLLLLALSIASCSE